MEKPKSEIDYIQLTALLSVWGILFYSWGLGTRAGYCVYFGLPSFYLNFESVQQNILIGIISGAKYILPIIIFSIAIERLFSFFTKNKCEEKIDRVLNKPIFPLMILFVLVFSFLYIGSCEIVWLKWTNASNKPQEVVENIEFKNNKYQHSEFKNLLYLGINRDFVVLKEKSILSESKKLIYLNKNDIHTLTINKK